MAGTTPPSISVCLSWIKPEGVLASTPLGRTDTYLRAGRYRLLLDSARPASQAVSGVSLHTAASIWFRRSAAESNRPFPRVSPLAARTDRLNF